MIPAYETTQEGPWRTRDEAIAEDFFDLMDRMVEKANTNYYELFGKGGAQKYYEQRSKRSSLGLRTSPTERRLHALMDALGYDEVRITIEVR
jgi:hypothetical protein